MSTQEIEMSRIDRFRPAVSVFVADLIFTNSTPIAVNAQEQDPVLPPAVPSSDETSGYGSVEASSAANRTYGRCPCRPTVARLPAEAVIRRCLFRRVAFLHLRELRGVRRLAKLPGDALRGAENIAGVPPRIDNPTPQFGILVVPRLLLRRGMVLIGLHCAPCGIH